MNRFGTAIIVIFLGVLLGGCGGGDAPIWEKVKIGDLLPATRKSPKAQKTPAIINIDVYIIETPAERLKGFNGLWSMLDDNRFRIYNYKAFTGNYFSVGLGQKDEWEQVSDLMAKNGAERTETVSLILADGVSDDLGVMGLGGRKQIFYVGEPGQMQRVSIGPGTINLRVTARAIAGARGVCKVSVEPVFLKSGHERIKRSLVNVDSGEFVFEACGFEVPKMSPGEFFFFGSKKYFSNEMSLSGMLFSKKRGKAVNTAFLFICRKIVD